MDRNDAGEAGRRHFLNVGQTLEQRKATVSEAEAVCRRIRGRRSGSHKKKKNKTTPSSLLLFIPVSNRNGHVSFRFISILFLFRSLFKLDSEDDEVHILDCFY